MESIRKSEKIVFIHEQLNITSRENKMKDSCLR